MWCREHSNLVAEEDSGLGGCKNRACGLLPREVDSTIGIWVAPQ